MLWRYQGRELYDTFDNTFLTIYLFSEQGHLKAATCSIVLGLVHTQSDFCPVSRFCCEELDVEISAMEALLNDTSVVRENALFHTQPHHN